MSFLLDTNVVSEVRKARPNLAVKRWIESVSSDRLFLSVLVVGEIRRGIEQLRRKDVRQAMAHEEWLVRLHELYAERLLPVTLAVAEEWGRLNVPNPIPVTDGLMAATAKVNGLTLVTRNTADVARTGVSVLNPFE